MKSKTLVPIESREHLLSALAEASELEHNLMCLYLYAVFSLKQSTEEDLTVKELEAVQRWRRQIMEVAIQEMAHLALVANLTTAVGGSAHFDRPSFPVAPGYFPDEFVVELARFEMATVDHFIFLERPENLPVEASSEFEPEVHYSRSAVRGRLMAQFGNYRTVGELYGAIEKGISYLSEQLGETNLFCGSLALQITIEDLKLEGLTLINDQKSALKAIQTIIEQGEGARNEKGSHFEKFKKIKAEYVKLLESNPQFSPSRPCARNPVMRKPVQAGNVTWISHTRSAVYLDLGNGIYSLMLRFLTQVYSMESRPQGSKKLWLEAAFSLMHGVAQIASLLSQMPATDEDPSVHAGLSFSLNRHLNPLELTSEKKILVERLEEISSSIQLLIAEELTAGEAARAKVLENLNSKLESLRDQLRQESQNDSNLSQKVRK